MDAQSVLQAAQSDACPPVLVCYGGGEYRLARFVDQLLTQLHPDASERDMAVIHFNMMEDPLTAALDEAATLPFLAQRKTVICHHCNFLTGRERKAGEPEHDLEALLAYLEAPATTTVLLLLTDSEKLDERKKLVKRLKQHHQLMAFPPWNEQEALKWVLAEAKLQQARMAEQTAQALIRQVGLEPEQLAGEVAKLAMYAGGQPIDERMIAQLVVRTPEQNVFQMVNAVAEQRIATAMQVMQDLILQKEEPLKILMLLARQVRLMITALELSESGQTTRQIAQVHGVHPYAAKVALDNAQKIGRQHLLTWQYELAQLDYAIKSGRVDKVRGLEMFLLRRGQKKPIPS